MSEPRYVTLYVYRVTPSHVRAHECLGESCLYLGDLTLPRARMPTARAGDRMRLRIS
jgi:hypothetical protein